MASPAASSSASTSPSIAPVRSGSVSTVEAGGRDMTASTEAKEPHALDGPSQISTVAATAASAGGLPGASTAATAAVDHETPTTSAKSTSPLDSVTDKLTRRLSRKSTSPRTSSRIQDELIVHRSALPLFLYPLSFAPPVPSPLRSPRAFIRHPVVLYIIGILAAIVAGMALPSLDLIYGVVWTNALTRPGVSPDEIRSASDHAGWLVVMVGAVAGFFSWLFLTCFSLASYQLCNGLRYAYVASVVSQDISYFDEHGAGEVAAHSGKEIAAIRAGFGEKFGFLIWSSSTLVTAVTIGFNTQARVVATLLSLIPFVLGMFAIVGIVTDRIGVPALKLEGRVASFLETALGSMRVVQSFNMQGHLLKRLDGEMLQRLSSYDRSIALMRGVGGAGALYFALNVCYALAFFVIGRFIKLYNVEIGSSITAFWNVINFLFALTSVLPHVSAIATALAAMKHMRRAIEREPRIDVRDVNKGLRPTDYAASLELRGVTMAYPTRPGVAVLKDVTIDVPAAKVTALVGPSGSGKSSIIHLLLREMDPEFANVPHPVDMKEKEEALRKERKREESQRLGFLGSLRKSLGLGESKKKRSDAVAIEGKDDDEKEAASPKGSAKDMPEAQKQEESGEIVQGGGQVLFAGIDVRELNVRWLRSQIAIVNQHPQIFTATLLENVAEGLVGTDLLSHLGDDEETPEYRAAVRDLVKQALIKAEAWEFVSRLPEGMDTKVNGGRAGLLSGGQKQRIALARALVRQPRVLILDEGTSALDSRSESKITTMLAEEQRLRGMTVILIAHRLSTVRNADQIIVLKAGRVRDVGKHAELMDKEREDATYRNMVLTQQAIVRIDENDEEQKRKDAEAEEAAETWTPASADDKPKLTAAEKAAEDAQALEEANNAPPDPAPNQRVQFKAVFRPLAWSFIIGILLAIAGAANFPLSGWMFGEALPNLATRANFWALWFFILAICAGIVISAESFMLEHASQRLMRQLRVRAFKSLVKQEIGFFDEPRVASGALTGAVSTHPASVGAATGLVMSQIILSAANLCGSMALGIALNWKLGLATCLPPVCVLLVAGWSNAKYIESYETLVSSPEGAAASFIAESVDAVQELIALGLERSRLARFRKQATAADDGLKAGKHLMIGALGFAIGQATVLLNCGLIFHYGGSLLANGDIAIETLYSVTEAAFIATFTAGRVLSFGGDIGRALSSFRALSSWFEREPRIASLPSNLVKDRSALADGSFAKGSFEFKNVQMRYPQRRQHRALDDLNLVIPAGKTVCFCGPSGGGKSSIFQLIERFYEPSRGTITLGGVDIRSMPPEELRRHIAIVSQDPTLFDGSIRWNLALGSDDPSSVTDEEIEEACRQAMILDFIKSLPQGFDTNCGIRGADMSGGQRQRLCIARAIIRNPSILLLDEATSALDAEAEAACISALERASKGRTTISIAHRLSTIRNADVIHVLEEGRIVESGTHNQLLRREGRYKELVEAQL